MAETIQQFIDRMLRTVPAYYHTASVYEAILKAWASEIQGRAADQDDLVAQLNVQTATWGLEYWELDYNVIAQPGDSYEVRRSRLMTKIIGLGTFTPSESKALANVYSRQKTAQHYDIAGTYSFKTSHQIDELIDYAGMIGAFKEMTPAHLKHIIGLLIQLQMGPNMRKYEYITQLLIEKYLTYTKKVRLRLSGEIMGSGKYDPLYVDGVINNPPTLYTNGAWDLNGYYTLNGDNHDKHKLYTRQSETLYIRKKDSSTGALLGEWTIIDRPK